ncbi:MAG: sodium:solute symporter family protein [Candidatus Glassbacteria bacterium]|nr:sodium:solute symporter family protein [Candidatus Glassbacteria bacterium]
MFQLHAVDLFIIVFYFVFVLGVGFYLKQHTRSGKDFFQAGQNQTAWIAGLSFIAANMGALELMGWSSATYQYGLLSVHWYWIGAIPAILFLGIFMMPFYHISRTHSVPGYLKLRFDEKVRSLSAITFGVMTLLASGISMYAMGLVLENFFGWDFDTSIWITALTVAAYVTAAGLTSAIFNEIVQFFLIWAGCLLIPILGLIEVGGFDKLAEMVQQKAQLYAAGGPVLDRLHIWSTMASPTDNPMGMHWLGIVMGLCFVLSMGYWTTDFLVVQRVLTAKDIRSAKTAPILGSFFKMAIPFIVILPGLIGFAVLPQLVPEGPGVNATQTYNAVLPLLMKRYFGPGMIGLGVIALIAGFMSGMAGNISAFATVWTYDIYRSLIRKEATDGHYLKMGRWCTVLGVLISIGTTYIVKHFHSIMDYMQALFSFFIAPLFATVLLGMFWKRTTGKAAFWGLLLGMSTSIGIFLGLKFEVLDPSYVAMNKHASTMAANMWQAIWAFLVNFIVTVTVTLFTKPRPVHELEGLVYGVSEVPHEGPSPWYRRPAFWAWVSFAIFIWLNIIFW